MIDSSWYLPNHDCVAVSVLCGVFAGETTLIGGVWIRPLWIRPLLWLFAKTLFVELQVKTLARLIGSNTQSTREISDTVH